MDFRQRLEQSRTKQPASAPIGESEAQVASPYFAIDRGSQLTCLDVRLKGGVRKAVPYNYITEMNFDIDEGIEILTSRKRIQIIGRNLSKLFDYLLTYRVRYVQGNVGSDGNEDDLFVKEVMVEEI